MASSRPPGLRARALFARLRRSRQRLFESIHAHDDAHGGLSRVSQALLAVHIAIELHQQLVGVGAHLAVEAWNRSHWKARIVGEGFKPPRDLTLGPLIVVKRAQHPEKYPELAHTGCDAAA